MIKRTGVGCPDIEECASDYKNTYGHYVGKEVQIVTVRSDRVVGIMIGADAVGTTIKTSGLIRFYPWSSVADVRAKV